MNIVELETSCSDNIIEIPENVQNWSNGENQSSEAYHCY